MNWDTKEDFQELIQFKEMAQKRELKLIEIITELRKSFVEVCNKHGEEANTFMPYRESLTF